MMTIRTRKSLTLAALAVFALVTALVALPPRTTSGIPLIGPALAQLRVNLGLDLQGGIHLEYVVDLSGITDRNGNSTDADEREKALSAVQGVVERRVNAFGVGESVVQRVRAGEEERLVVELPGIKDLEGAKDLIRATPYMDFREEVMPDDPTVAGLLASANEQAQATAAEVLRRALAGEDFAALARQYSEDYGTAEQGGDLGFAAEGSYVPAFDAVAFAVGIADGTVHPTVVETDYGWHIIRKEAERTTDLPVVDPATGTPTDKTEATREVQVRHILLTKKTLERFPDLQWRKTDLTGAQLASADFDPGTASAQGGLPEPKVLLHFTEEGGRLFAEITKRMVDKRVAIFLDGQVISAPVIRSEITGGEAEISGSFTVAEAKQLAGRLNEGALPVPITLDSQYAVDAALGQSALRSGLVAGAVGLAVVMIYMTAYYRLFGLVAALALLVYTAVMMTLFKLSSLLPGGLAITFTLSGIAGFILSIGMAVDANVLIFERIKEERHRGKTLKGAVAVGFDRAWTSIRDGHVSTLLTCVILVGMGTTGFVKGFAIVLFIGVAMSLFTAVVLTRSFLMAVADERLERHPRLIL